jgi:hypothetical protein
MKLLNSKGREGEKQNDSRNGSERGGKEADARNNDEESCLDPTGKNIRQGVLS